MSEPFTIAAAMATAKRLMDAKTEAEKNVLLIEFQTITVSTLSRLAELQLENASLKSENHELKQERMRLQDWSAQKVGYALRQVGEGVFAQVKNDQAEDLQAAHKLCSSCFDKSIKSLLQQATEHPARGGRGLSLTCPNGCPKLHFNYYLQ